MGLDKYIKKRRFDRTPEPTGGGSKSGKLIFVVQKHAASHLHYDFRLELKGVLKSWAVPKGPSMNPENHRFAQEVEDHPFDYKDFEGIIPKGQYGGGTVIIWDQGTYEPAEKFKTKKEQEHWLTSHYYKNELRIKLKGKKLKGEFVLNRSKEKGENAWLLTKVGDKYATDKDITQKDKSVVSGLSLEQMAKNAEAAIWNSNRAESSPPADIPELNELLKKGTKKTQPARIEPMLCTLIREPFNDPDWLFEVKLDGYRILANKQKDKISLKSRKLDFTKNYKAVADALAEIGRDFIIDGEVVAIGDKGLPDFDALQSYRGDVQLQYYVFDILWLDGLDLTSLPLTWRRALLQGILPENELIKFSKDFENGEELFQAVKAQGLEGVIAKRKDSSYLIGKRSSNWLKLPTKRVQDFVVGAWTESESGKAFRSLIFGNYRDNKLSYVGHVGLGFKEEERSKILKRLKALEINKSSFSGKVETETKAHWISPQLVVSVEFATWTGAGNIRKPATFKGFRDDKEPQSVLPEEPLSKKEEDRLVHNHSPGQKQGLTTSEDSNWPILEKEEISSERMFPIEGYQVRITNLEKELWEGVTKAHLLQYYHSVSHYLLPFLKGRPLSLYIKPGKPTAPGLYIKDMEGRQPEFADIYSMQRKHKKKGKRDVIDYLLCNNLATLWYIVNLGCIDINPWASRTGSADMPDFISVDLDPSDEDFSKAVKAALAAKEVFDEYKLKAFVKTSGKTGIHLLLPCSDFKFPDARSIAERLCEEIHSRVPDITTTELSINRRGTRLYLDPNQNDIADTLASPYSVRPAKLPTVSTPLDWTEINDELQPSLFTIHTIAKRLKEKGDLWAGLLDAKILNSNNRNLRRLTGS